MYNFILNRLDVYAYEIFFMIFNLQLLYIYTYIYILGRYTFFNLFLFFN